jgi:hypothetical protein
VIVELLHAADKYDATFRRECAGKGNVLVTTNEVATNDKNKSIKGLYRGLN